MLKIHTLKDNLNLVEEILKIIWVKSIAYPITDLYYSQPIEDYELLNFYFKCGTDDLFFAITNKLDFYIQDCKNDNIITNYNQIRFYKKLMDENYLDKDFSFCFSHENLN
jgi:hypothetical protein